MKSQLDLESEDVLLGTPSHVRTGMDSGVLDPVLPNEIFAPAIERASNPTEPAVPRQRRRAPDEELLAKGAIVDKYRIDGLLGKGGFAAVYKATHLLLGTQVAIKLLRPTILKRQPSLAAELCAEARFAAPIDHPNVVRILDVTTGEALTYIVMEYIEGGSLAQRIYRGGHLAPAALLRVGQQVVAGLAAGLERGLIHRDIKPANILLTRAGDAKIVDFGLARHLAESGATKERRATVVGTYGYMSPDQADNPDTVDFRSDIYSLGITLYEAATGILPFPTNDHAACIALHKTRPVPRIEERVPGFPAAVSSLINWMLSKKRDDRPPSYAALHTAMARTLAMIDDNKSKNISTNTFVS